jgi:hypothetical protein
VALGKNIANQQVALVHAAMTFMMRLISSVGTWLRQTESLAFL